MEPVSPVDGDPFADPVMTIERPNDAVSSTLVIGKEVSLTLATDSLIVLGTPFHVAALSTFGN